MNTCPKTKPVTQSCPMSHSLESGTWDKTPINRDSQEDKSGTRSLKSLAYKVLQWDKERDKNGTTQKKEWDKTLQKKALCPTLSQPVQSVKKLVPIVSNLEEQAATVGAQLQVIRIATKEPVGYDALPPYSFMLSDTITTWERLQREAKADR